MRTETEIRETLAKYEALINEEKDVWFWDKMKPIEVLKWVLNDEKGEEHGN
jgi:hypothetical protein